MPTISPLIDNGQMATTLSAMFGTIEPLIRIPKFIKRFAFALIAGLSFSLCHAEATKTIYNPFTGKLDFITALTTNSVTSSGCISITTTTAGFFINSAGCGGGSGSPLEVFSNFDATRTSPTLSISIGDSLLMGVTGSTAALNVDISSVTFGLITESSVSANYITISSVSANFLTQSSATANYLTLASSGNFLTTSSASATYFPLISSTTLLTTSSATANFLTLSSATATYFQIASTVNFVSQSSATTNLLSQSSATATYLQIASSQTFMSQSSATANFLSLSSATANYLTLSSASATYFQTNSSNTFIQNRNTLQPGSTFFVSSGSISGQLSANTAVFGSSITTPSQVNLGNTGWIGMRPRDISSSRTLGYNEGSFFRVDATGGLISIQLPDIGQLTSPQVDSMVLTFCKSDSSTNGVIFTAAVGDTAPALLPAALTTENQCVTLVSSVTAGSDSGFWFPMNKTAQAYGSAATIQINNGSNGLATSAFTITDVPAVSLTNVLFGPNIFATNSTGVGLGATFTIYDSDLSNNISFGPSPTGATENYRFDFPPTHLEAYQTWTSTGPVGTRVQLQNTTVIVSTNNLQSGSTFYVSSGSVNGQLTGYGAIVSKRASSAGPPFVVTSTVMVSNLNVNYVSSYTVGTSGLAIPLLDNENIWNGVQKHKTYIVMSDPDASVITFPASASADFNIQNGVSYFGDDSVSIIDTTNARDIANFGVSQIVLNNDTTINNGLTVTGLGTITSLINSSLSNQGPTIYSSSTTATLTANQNNYVLPSRSFVRVSANAARTITGFAALADGTLKYFVNVGTNSITLSNNSASSSASNRIITHTGADFVLVGSDTAHILYDSTSARWRTFK